METYILGPSCPNPQSLPLSFLAVLLLLWACAIVPATLVAGMLMVTVGSGDVATDGGAGNSGRSWEKGLKTFRGSYSSHPEF